MCIRDRYNVSTGFAWNDLAGKTMWKDGAVVAGTGSNGFANSVTNPLDIYGLACLLYTSHINGSLHVSHAYRIV